YVERLRDLPTFMVSEVEIHLLGNILHTSPDTTTQRPVSSNQPAPAVVPAVAPPNQENPQAQNPDPPAKAVASPLPQASPALTTNMISGMRLPKEIDVSDHKIGVGDPVKRGDTVSVRYRVQYPDPLQPGKTVDFQSNLTEPEPYTFVVDPDGPDAGKALRSYSVNHPKSSVMSAFSYLVSKMRLQGTRSMSMPGSVMWGDKLPDPKLRMTILPCFECIKGLVAVPTDYVEAMAPSCNFSLYEEQARGVTLNDENKRDKGDSGSIGTETTTSGIACELLMRFFGILRWEEWPQRVRKLTGLDTKEDQFALENSRNVLKTMAATKMN
ncbi:hypothetical protein K474DRAFT_1680965, partial [Panus rudis PR-1116 ss-1]